MAVVVQCYHCSNILELDDGFRGGVCRCSQCGALLQVPKGSSTEMRKARPAAPGAMPTDLKRPDSPLADPGLSRGQFDPRSPRIQGGSGGSSETGISSGAFARSPSRPAAPAAVARHAKKARPVESSERPSRTNTWLYVSLGLVLVVTLVFAAVVTVWVVSTMKSSDQKPGSRPLTGSGGGGIVTPQPLPDQPQPVPVPQMTSPNFFTVPLVGHKIVFSIDTGTSGQDSFDYVRKGLEKAIGMLGSDQQFKVALWQEHGVRTLPAAGWQTKSGMAGVVDEIRKTGTMGTTDAETAMKASLQLGGDQVIIVTCKPLLPPTLAPAVLGVRTSGQRIDVMTTVVEEGSPLEEITMKGNGKFVRANQTLLESFAADR